MFDLVQSANYSTECADGRETYLLSACFPRPVPALSLTFLILQGSRRKTARTRELKEVVKFSKAVARVLFNLAFQ